METQGAAYEYLPVARVSSYTEQKDYDGLVYPRNESQTRLIKRKRKGETTNASDEFIRPPLKLRNSRIVRLIVFIMLEAMWLGFGLVVYFRPIVIPSGDIRLGRISTSSTSIFAAAFGSLGILWQSLALLTIADIVQEIYSGEWHELVKKQAIDQGQTIRNMDIVSTIVAGCILQARHAFRSGHSTLRYKLAVIISLLVIALSAIAPNAINISPISSEKTLIIGGISPDATSTLINSLNEAYGQFLSEVAQFETVVQLDGSPPELVIKDANGNPSSNVLFGVPLRSELGDTTDITRLSYISDAVVYNFSCQWLAPTSISLLTWSFGGDMTGTIDEAAEIVRGTDIGLSDLDSYSGIYPLNITHGAGAQNGSFAWFISSFHNYSDVHWENNRQVPYTSDVFVDLTSIPGSGKAYGNLSTYTQNDLDNTSTTDTILFCDPIMRMNRVAIDMSNDGSALTFRTLEGYVSAPVGNIDETDVSRILGRCLNGIPWESNVVTVDEGEHSSPSTLGQLTANLLFLPPAYKPIQSDVMGVQNQTIYSPRPLSNISSLLNSYTSIAGMNMYLSGSLGNHSVPTTGIYATQRLVVNWPQWFADLSIVLVVSCLIISLTIRDAIKGKELVPLTLNTMNKHTRGNYENLEKNTVNSTPVRSLRYAVIGMEMHSTAHKYMPVSQVSSFVEQRQDNEESTSHASNKSRPGLGRRPSETRLSKLSKKDDFIRPPLNLRNSRIVRLVIFLTLEMIWLSFGLAVYRQPIVIPSGNIRLGRISMSSSGLSAAAFGSLGILWQSLALLTIADIVQEIYSGEWHELVKKQAIDQGQTIRNMDIVSTLVAGRILQARHAFRSGHSTLRYKLAFIISLLVIALSAIAPNAINISPISSEKTLIIGGISPDATSTLIDSLNRTQYGQLLSEVVQFEYVVQQDGSPPEFVIKDANGNPSSNVLFGIPLRSELGNTTDITRLSYISDAVFYNFSCQWLAPVSISWDTWNFGGDMTGTTDEAAAFVRDPDAGLSYPASYFGIYPLNITHGAGAQNGSFAWFISSFYNYSDGIWVNNRQVPYTSDVFVDLTSIPGSGKAYGNLSTYTQNDLDNTSTTDTILFCDPSMRMNRVEVDISNDGSILTFRTLEGYVSAPVGNIDRINASWILGRGLNGIPWETNIVTVDEGEDFMSSTLGRLTSNLLFLPPIRKPIQYPIYSNGSMTYETVYQTIYSPQSLSNISSLLNSYTSIAGMNTYLSGSMGNHTVPTTGIYATQRLVVNWPQWFTNLSIVLVIAGFVILLTVRDAVKGRELVPLTVTTMERYLRDLEE